MLALQVLLKVRDFADEEFARAGVFELSVGEIDLAIDQLLNLLGASQIDA